MEKISVKCQLEPNLINLQLPAKMTKITINNMKCGFDHVGSNET